MRVLAKLWGLACLALPLLAWAQSAVESFSPEGTVKGVRQVKVRFSEQMVPFGDLRLSDPFIADCAEPGQGRWVDGRNWDYDFERDLPAGVACRFTLKPALADLAGQPLGGQRDFSFNTGGPSIAGTMPYNGANRIDENQVFVLSLDAVARDDSIAAHAYCTADGINEKIPVRLLAGKELEQVLAVRKDFIQRHLRVYYAARGVVWRTDIPVNSKRGERMPVAVLQCTRSLPADAKVTLVWGAAIATANGLANEKDQVLSFRTRPDFSARFSCERLSVKGQCIPFLPMRVDFSAPVRAADARAIAITGPGGKSWAAELSKDDAKSAYVSGVSIPGPFPEKAALRLTLPAAMRDDAGRSLVNQARFPLAVRTDEQPPLVKFPARFGIIESRGDRLLPVTVRNVEAGIAARMAKADGAVNGAMLRVGEAGAQAGQQDQQVMDWLRRMSGKRRESGWLPGELYKLDDSVFSVAKGSGAAPARTQAFRLPKPGGRKAFEVIGIPLRKPGFYVVELASPRLGQALQGKPSLAYVSAAALVTNMVAHFKHGAESSLVWVTSLDQGQPVPNAQVSVRACTGKLLWQGKTDDSGVARIGQELFHGGCPYSEGYFISARSGDDMTFTLSNWDQGIENWRFNVPINDLRADNTIAATVFDRTLLRAGETVHMKHFIRRHVADGFAYATPPDQDQKLFIIHQGSDQKYELPLSWAAGGIAENSWTIPVDARQGVYEVMFNGRSGGSFRVEQFRVPTMKAVLQGPSAPVVQASQVALDVQLNYLSGGGASGAQVKLRTTVEPRGVHFEDYADFSFAAGDVKPGKVQSGPAFDEDEGEFEAMPGEGEGEAGAGGAAVRTQSLTLDRAGGARVIVDQLPKIEQPRDLVAEMSYQDASGETLTSSTRVPLWPSNYLIGIKPDSWVMSKSALKFLVAVLDVQGKPVADAPVAVDFFQRLQYSHRRRLIGGFYAYENSAEIKARGAACTGKTDAKGLLACQVAAPDSGNLILRAATHDGEQREAVTSRETWVADGDDWWFKASDDDRIDLLPERKRYEPGEMATFQLRMPFRAATALVTVEREGILDTYVRPLSGSSPVFSIPVKANYGPNVFVSALVVRGRVADVQPTALVDLGKPAYKMGLAQLRVGWAANELKVQVKTDRPVYKVREQAQVTVKVTRADGSPAPPGAEIALAAVDVGLLELMPNASWDLLEAMMRQRGLQVETATAQMQVVGKRHFGRKAVPHGGGGGKGGGRELFDTLLYWKARVTLDANGEASVEVPVNDSLTAFRIVAIASANAGLFGTGRTEIRSAQDVMLLSGLPAMVREGDRFRAGFTLRNASQGDLTVELGAQVAGKTLPRQAVAIAAGMAKEVGWDYQVPVGATELAWDVNARIAGATSPADRLRVKQSVKAAVPVRTLQATLLQLDKPQTMPVAIPADALPGRGGVQASFAARLGSDLPGVRDYMRLYPYSCFEQNTSRAIALRHRESWDKLAAQLPAYLDSDGLVKYFPIMQQGSDSLTAYVLSAVSEAGYTIPAELKVRMEEALTGFVQGRITRGSPLATADLAVRKLAALEALSRSGNVTEAQLESFTLEPNLWPTSAVIDWYLIVQRSPKLAQHAQRMAQAQQILKSRLNLQGTTMGFSTERNDDWWWLMVSGDANANRLLLAMLDNPSWQPDIARLARGALGRQRHGHWDTTVANAWGVLALDKFSQTFEREPVAGSSTAAIAGASKSVELDARTVSGSVLIPWPRGTAELSLKHAGSGKPWVTVQSLAAIPLKAPLSSGYKIVKTITPVEQAVKGVWTSGDVYRVRLDLEAQADMTWVVVDDPIPASASVLGTGLGKDSQLLTATEKSKGWVWPAFQERTFEAFRSYYEFVPKGKWSVEYTVRLNNAGQFQLPPTRVEAMYSPEAFGESPNAAVSVK